MVYASCLILHTLWGLVDWGPFHNYAAPRYNLLAMTGNNAANISYSQWVNVMEQTIGILWMYLLPVTLWCLWEWYQHPGQKPFHPQTSRYYPTATHLCFVIPCYRPCTGRW
ncbi:hypothetical protein ACP0HM_35620 [Escherichia coli]